jgi:hypothetical protein
VIIKNIMFESEANTLLLYHIWRHMETLSF